MKSGYLLKLKISYAIRKTFHFIIAMALLFGTYGLYMFFSLKFFLSLNSPHIPTEYLIFIGLIVVPALPAIVFIFSKKFKSMLMLINNFIAEELGTEKDFAYFADRKGHWDLITGNRSLSIEERLISIENKIDNIESKLNRNE